MSRPEPLAGGPAPRTLGVVTARGGSKGIPGKNLKLLAGKPLIVHTIDAARRSSAFDRLIVSTDDTAIAETARAAGCEVPFRRPADLASDAIAHLPVMQHALRWLDEHEQYRPDFVMILQPTSPLRQPAHIRDAIDLLARTGADSVISVSAVPPHYHPLRALRVEPSGDARLFATGAPVRERVNRRQDMPPASVMNGAIYVFRRGVLFGDPPSLYGDRTVAYAMPDPFGLSIDEPQDWIEAERALAASVIR